MCLKIYLAAMDDQDATEFMDDDPDSPENDQDQSAFEETTAPTLQEPVEVPNARTLGQPLSDFLMTLEDYTPTVTSSQHA